MQLIDVDKLKDRIQNHKGMASFCKAATDTVMQIIDEVAFPDDWMPVEHGMPSDPDIYKVMLDNGNGEIDMYDPQRKEFKHYGRAVKAWQAIPIEFWMLKRQGWPGDH